MHSLTNTVILDSMDQYGQSHDCIESEIVTRTIALATSVFSLIDLIANIVATLTIGSYIVIKGALTCHLTQKEIDLFSTIITNIFKFTMLTAFGSVIGIAAPHCLVFTFHSSYKPPSATITGSGVPPLPPQPPVTSQTTLIQPPITGPVTPPVVPPTPPVTVQTTVVPPVQPTRPVAPPVVRVPFTGMTRGTSTVSKNVTVTGNALIDAHNAGIYIPSKPPTSLAKIRPINLDAEKEAYERLTLFAQMVQEGETSIILDGGIEESVIDALKDFLAAATIYTKLRFYEVFNADLPGYDAIRKEFVKEIFQSKYHTVVRPPVWLSDSELIDEAEKLSTTATLKTTLAAQGIEWDDNFHKGFYYHATKTLTNLTGILTGKKLEVRMGGYFGAYISTQPECMEYGRYVFALKEKVAHTCPQVSATKTEENRYWSGMSQDIDINADSLAYIMVADTTAAFGSDMEPTDTLITRARTEIKRLVDAGVLDKEIPVVRYSDMEPHRLALLSLNRGIPKSWQKPGTAAVGYYHDPNP